MKLRDNQKDFVNALRVAASELAIPDRQLEKDYWVTEVLRAISTFHEGWTLFKGGTSLSKGWKIIQRFSEDIDLLLLSDPGEPTEMLLDDLMKTAAAVCGSDPIVESRVDGHAQRVVLPFPKVPNVKNAPGMRKDILLEPGVRGGPRPREVVSVQALLVDGLLSSNAADYEDLGPFNVETLHPARTFVEKLFAVDGMARRLLSDPDREVRGTEARHFYDLYFLADPDGPVLSYLRGSDDYMDLVGDCEAVSQRWYPERATRRPDGGFSGSAAFTDIGVAKRVGSSYERTMADLCYPTAERPSFDAVVERLRALSWL